MYSNDHQSTEENSNAVIVQRSLTIGAANDPLEHEAESMADRVMRMPEASIQRKCAHCEEEEKVQRKPLASFIQKMGIESGTVASNSVSNQIHTSRGNGNRLDTSTQSFMQSRFGSDFSNVNIHTGTDAIQMSRELNAKAFTVGNDIYFNEGQYNPSSHDGRHLLAHELTHTIQQGKSEKVQKSCFDGACDTCAGGRKRLSLTAFFRVRATRENMIQVRREINEAKRVLANCCVDLSVFFDWRLLRGGGSFNPGTARPAGSPDGVWDYTNDSETLGEGNTFSGARGIPMLIVDEVPTTGGGVTVSHDFDNQFTGTPYIVIGINQAGGNPQSSIAHELGHRAGILPHSTAANHIMGNAGENVDEPYCNAIRAMAT